MATPWKVKQAYDPRQAGARGLLPYHPGSGGIPANAIMPTANDRALAAGIRPRQQPAASMYPQMTKRLMSPVYTPQQSWDRAVGRVAGITGENLDMSGGRYNGQPYSAGGATDILNGGPARDTGINPYTDSVLARVDPYPGQRAAQPNMAYPWAAQSRWQQLADQRAQQTADNEAAGSLMQRAARESRLQGTVPLPSSLTATPQDSMELDNGIRVPRLGMGAGGTPVQPETSGRYNNFTDWTNATIAARDQAYRGEIPTQVGPWKGPSGIDRGRSTTQMLGNLQAAGDPAAYANQLAQRKAMVTANAQNRSDVRGARAGRLPWDAVRERITPPEAAYRVNPTQENLLAAYPEYAPYKWNAEAMGGKMDMAANRDERRSLTEIITNPNSSPEMRTWAEDKLRGMDGDGSPTATPTTPTTEKNGGFNPWALAAAGVGAGAGVVAAPWLARRVIGPTLNAWASWGKRIPPSVSGAGVSAAAKAAVTPPTAKAAARTAEVARLKTAASAKEAAVRTAKAAGDSKAAQRAAAEATALREKAAKLAKTTRNAPKVTPASSSSWIKRTIPWLGRAAKVMGPVGIALTLNDMAQAAGQGSEIQPGSMTPEQLAGLRQAQERAAEWDRLHPQKRYR